MKLIGIGILWLVVSIGIARFIKGGGFRGMSNHKLGFVLIALSFICGISLLLLAVTSI